MGIGSINKKKLILRTGLVLVVLAIGFLYFANRFIKTKGFDNLSDFWTNYSKNKDLADNVEPENLKILISDEDYDFLVERRKESLNRGIQINKGNKYISCMLVTEGDTIQGEMRLKGHMTDHLEGDKWSFRVKTEGEYKEMYRFSLQNPATRSYANEWVYHELLKGEGIMALKYDFIHLELNDKDLGIYAIEEHFGQHVPLGNDRPKGAVLRWNPELYWEQRIRGHEFNYLDLQDGEFQNSFVEPYDKGVIKKDSALIETYLKGAYLLERFRRGELKAIDVFDIEKMAGFHAVIDLVGGHHSLDWSDVKLFYNSESKKIEPVGYESFSVKETVSLAGQLSPNDYSSKEFNYHAQLFKDADFFEAYIKALTRIAKNDYLAAFEKDVEGELNKKIGILAHEFAYIKFSYEPYYKNIKKIQDILEMEKPLHAFLEEKSDSTVIISVTPVSDFPLEVVGLKIKNGNIISPDSNFIIPAKARNTYAHYFEFGFDHNAKKLKDLVLVTKIPGGQEFNVEVLEFPSFHKSNITVPEESESSVLNYLNDSTVVFPNKLTKISENITIQKGTSLFVYAGQFIEFDEGGSLYCEGEIKMIGNDEEEIEIICNSKNESCIQLQSAQLYMSNTSVTGNTSSIIQSNNSSIDLNKCYFSEIAGVLVDAESSVLNFQNCVSGQVNSMVDISNSEFTLGHSTLSFGDELVKSKGSIITIDASQIKNYNQLFNLDHVSSIELYDSNLTSNEKVATLNNGSYFKTFKCFITGSKVGFTMDDASFSSKESTYILYRTESDIETLEVRNS